MESLHLKKKPITAELPKGAAWGTRVAAVAIFILLAAGLSFAGGNQQKRLIVSQFQFATVRWDRFLPRDPVIF